MSSTTSCPRSYRRSGFLVLMLLVSLVSGVLGGYVLGHRRASLAACERWLLRDQMLGELHTETLQRLLASSDATARSDASKGLACVVDACAKVHGDIELVVLALDACRGLPPEDACSRAEQIANDLHQGYYRRRASALLAGKYQWLYMAPPATNQSVPRQP